MSIYAKLLAAQKSITAIGKTGHNSHFNYDFFEEREVLRVAREALNNAGLAFLYSVDDVSDQAVTTAKGKEELLTDVRMTCTIYDAESGESVSGGAIGRGQDGQDKGVNKAIVAGLKYWLLKTLMIPTDDDTERDENSDPERSRASGSARPSGNGRAAKNGHAPAGDMIACPACGGEMWDNRTGKKNPRAPDLKCKDKDGCDHAIWLPTWRDDLLKSLADAHTAGVIDMGQREAGEEMVRSLNPRQMQTIATRIQKLEAGLVSP